MKRRNKLLLFSPAFHPLTRLHRNGDFQNINTLVIRRLTHLTPYFRVSNFLYDFYRLSSITKFAETGIHKHQYFDYQTINPLNVVKHNVWIHEAFTPKLSQVCAIRPERLISCQSASHAARTLPCQRWHYS